MELLADARRRLEHWIRFVGVRRVVVGTVLGFSVLMVCAWMFLPAPPAPESSIPLVSPPSSMSGTTIPPAVVRVHVAGAVKKPGVYRLRSTDRVVDAVTAAGGASASADLDAINLAQTILDTEQIYVPRRATHRVKKAPAPRLRPVRATSTTVSSADSQVPQGNATPAPSSKVNINTATATQLDALPGVGPSTAKAIIAYRQSKGPFTKVEDLLNVPGIGPSKLDAMRGMIAT